MSLPNSLNNLNSLDVYNKKTSIETEKTRYDLKWDFKKNDFYYDEKGSPILLKTKKEIVKQWIIKCLIVQKDAWRNYYKDTYSFGVGINKYKGINPLFHDYAKSEIKREIKNALKLHKYIKSIENYTSYFLEDKLFFEFEVILNSKEKETLNISEVFEFGR